MNLSTVRISWSSSSTATFDKCRSASASEVFFWECGLFHTKWKETREIKYWSAVKGSSVGTDAQMPSGGPVSPKLFVVFLYERRRHVWAPWAPHPSSIAPRGKDVRLLIQKSDHIRLMRVPLTLSPGDSLALSVQSISCYHAFTWSHLETDDYVGCTTAWSPAYVWIIKVGDLKQNNISL